MLKIDIKLQLSQQSFLQQMEGTFSDQKDHFDHFPCFD